jgi:hypothetical protein
MGLRTSGAKWYERMADRHRHRDLRWGSSFFCVGRKAGNGLDIPWVLRCERRNHLGFTLVLAPPSPIS